MKNVVLMGLVFAMVGSLMSSCNVVTDTNDGIKAAVPRQPGLAKRQVQTFDELMVSIADDVPGFAGVFTENGKVVVMQRGAGRVDGALLRLADIVEGFGSQDESFRGELRSRFANATLRQAQYGFRDLYDVYRRVTKNLWENVNGITMTDIDERRNRIVIGVKDDHVREVVMAHLMELDAEPRMFIIETFAPVVSAVDKSEMAPSLLDQVRPVIGGLAIQQSVGSYPCNLGFIGRRRTSSSGPFDGKSYFLTNSHCTKEFATLNSPLLNYIGQPTSASSQRIGFESVDPPHNPNVVGCPNFWKCRQSDASLHEFDSGVAASFAQVAFPALGSTEFSETISVYDTFESIIMLVNGGSVTKVGRMTGRTAGQIDQTCVSAGDESRNIWIGCSFGVNAGGENGDSGSPVMLLGPLRTYAVGMLWAARPSGGYLFSPLSLIRGEIAAAASESVFQYEFGNQLSMRVDFTLVGPEELVPEQSGTWSAVNITVGPDGSDPFSFQWFVNGDTIFGQTAQSFSTNLAPGQNHTVAVIVKPTVGISRERAIQVIGLAEACPGGVEIC